MITPLPRDAQTACSEVTPESGEFPADYNMAIGGLRREFLRGGLRNESNSANDRGGFVTGSRSLSSISCSRVALEYGRSLCLLDRQEVGVAVVRSGFGSST